MKILHWNTLGPDARREALRRPALTQRESVVRSVRDIVSRVRAEGDAALAHFTREFDRAALTSFEVTTAEKSCALSQLNAAQRDALECAIANVRRFHTALMPEDVSLETAPGVLCERITRPIGAVGLYAPAGSAPLPSAVIMLAVPAAIAGCPVRVLCTPPGANGEANATIVAAAVLCGIERIFKIGGAQAIAALAYGTASIPKVEKIFGPGNAWVTAAKQLVSSDPEGAAVDLPAGPSEVLVIADESARAELVAADLLAQAEHDPLSQAILVTPSEALAAATAVQVAAQEERLSRRAILRESLAASRAIVVPGLDTAIAVSNEYAPEHLILQIREPRAALAKITAAGSIFVGEWSPESLGDYCSGTNHVLPTYGYARAYSGLSTLDFVRRITVQEASPRGLETLGPVAAELARLEGLDAHAAAVDRRLALLDAESGASA